MNNLERFKIILYICTNRNKDLQRIRFLINPNLESPQSRSRHFYKTMLAINEQWLSRLCLRRSFNGEGIINETSVAIRETHFDRFLSVFIALRNILPRFRSGEWSRCVYVYVRRNKSNNGNAIFRRQRRRGGEGERRREGQRGRRRKNSLSRNGSCAIQQFFPPLRLAWIINSIYLSTILSSPPPSPSRELPPKGFAKDTLLMTYPQDAFPISCINGCASVCNCVEVMLSIQTYREIYDNHSMCETYLYSVGDYHIRYVRFYHNLS